MRNGSSKPSVEDNSAGWVILNRSMLSGLRAAWPKNWIGSVCMSPNGHVYRVDGSEPRALIKIELQRDADHGAGPAKQGWACSPAIRRCMQANRGRDTQLELVIRRLVHRMGLRYRANARIDAGRAIRADIVFAKARLAVFLDGCFWHCCPLHGSLPKTNREFWMKKLMANRRRDEFVTMALRDAGWSVLRIWEHEGPVKSAATIRQHVVGQLEAAGVIAGSDTQSGTV